MEQRLLKVENDLVHTLDVVNKQLKLNKTLTEEKDKNQKFVDDVVDGLLNNGKITFWARDDEVNFFNISYRRILKKWNDRVSHSMIFLLKINIVILNFFNTIVWFSFQW